jgi:multidrug efflux pump subunit AcrA (membrane-fusion protein)
MVVKPEAGLDPSLAGQSVRLTVEAASTGHEVLVVPVSAISSGADGKTSVQVEESDGSRRRVHVAVGATGDGHVEVGVLPGSSLRENERVVTGLGAGRGSEGAR